MSAYGFVVQLPESEMSVGDEFIPENFLGREGVRRVRLGFGGKAGISSGGIAFRAVLGLIVRRFRPGLRVVYPVVRVDL